MSKYIISFDPNKKTLYCIAKGWGLYEQETAITVIDIDFHGQILYLCEFPIDPVGRFEGLYINSTTYFGTLVNI